MAVELMGDRAPSELKARIEREIDDLDALIGELILASRIEARQAMGREEKIDLLALSAEEASKYDARLTGAPTEIAGDRALLRQLVRNLLENARKHAPDSPIEISVSPAAGGGARIQVLDRGAGVAEEHRERIFEPFYKAPGTANKGVGLGLALVRTIARYHGGDARCLARPGGGSLFEVELAPK
jgi:signal transduction histidine kinase